MDAALLIDFGSTYTKTTAVDLGAARLLACASAHTTVETDVGEGLRAAMDDLERAAGRPIDYGLRLACSSAAGGLKMVACGLVPDLTAKAARLAALGAGAKVARVFSFELTDDDLREIDSIAPDIILLTGGTDGGNSKCVVHNAGALSGLSRPCPIVAAGNRACARRVMEALAGLEAHSCENVMPALGALNIAPAREKIRDIFLDRIVRAKGLSREAALVDGILMPTPAAVLAATELLSLGHGNEPGLGDLFAVDLGGATTDVYSIAEGMPGDSGVIFRGLPEPRSLRTVEGDIGMRYSASGVVEAAGISKVARLSGLSQEAALRMTNELARRPDSLPAGADDEALDFALAALAIETATLRHAGEIEKVYTAAGAAYVQTGKDLRDAAWIALTGGALARAKRPAELAARAMSDDSHPQSLRPARAKALVDRDYILSAMGLLASRAPEAALKIMKQSLKAID
ncbi:MAG: methylaspartate mutase accessory protein GlmL [Treponema sp.]|nr:methylaspartate mutase accessory protein GlmL [Treponema sp.]